MSEYDDDHVSDLLGEGLKSGIRYEQTRGSSVESSSSTGTSEQPETDLLPEELAGYPVLEFLARGGVGLVYRVSDPILDRDLAIKVLSRRFASSAEMVQRFRGEANLCAGLQHPGIVPIHQLGELEDGRPFFTMQVVEGETLAQLLRSRKDKRVSLRSLLEIFAKVCQTVAYVHAQGVVHGDLKPANVMIGAFGEIQVMDWGFAHSIAPEPPTPPEPLGDEGDASQSSSPRILGTPAYMAPEQARGNQQAINTQTDVFGLGSILCEILTGQPPHPGSSKTEIYLQAVEGSRVKAEAMLQDCDADPELVELTRRCLAADPTQRPEAAGSVNREVTNYLESIEARSRQMEIRVTTAEEKAAQERRHRKAVLGLSIAIVTAVLALAVSMLGMYYRDFQRQQKAHDIVVEAAERARSLQRLAQRHPPGEVEPWREALLAAEQAEALAVSNDAHPDDLESTRILRTAAAKDAEAAERARDLLGFLEQVRPHCTTDLDAEDLQRDYTDGLARFGFDMESGSVESLAEKIQATSIATAFCDALGDWAATLEGAEGGGEQSLPEWRRLLQIALLADPDPFRNQIREAMLDGDADALVRLATAEELPRSSRVTISLLAKSLLRAGHSSAAITILREASYEHPTDYHIHHDLAFALRTLSAVPWREVISLTRVAASIRPDDPHALADHAYSLIQVYDYRTAEALLRRSLEIHPDYSRSWSFLCRVLLPQGRLREAQAAAERGLATAGDSRLSKYFAIRWIPAWYLGRFDEARLYLEQASALRLQGRPLDQAFAWLDLHSGDPAAAEQRIVASSDVVREMAYSKVLVAQSLLEQGRFELAAPRFTTMIEGGELYLMPYHGIDVVRDRGFCIELNKGSERLAAHSSPEACLDPADRAWTAAAAALTGDSLTAVTWYESSFADAPELFAHPQHVRWAATAAARLALDLARDLDSRNAWSSNAAQWLQRHLSTIPDRAPAPAPYDSFEPLGWIRRIQASVVLAPFWSDASEVPSATRIQWSELARALESRADTLFE